MQVKQIFKPFEQFEAGEFDKMFANGKDLYTFAPAIAQNGITLFHIVVEEKEDGKYFKVLARAFHESEATLVELTYAQSSYFATPHGGKFFALSEAYNAIRNSVLEHLWHVRAEVEHLKKIAEMPFGEYVKLEEVQHFLRKKHKNQSSLLKQLSEPLAEAAEQFPSL
jgi:hypothetical protein